MVRRQKRDSTERRVNKGENEQHVDARKISAATQYETCSELLSAFGGVLALIKLLDLIQFEDFFEHCYTKPARETKLGHYRMVVGIVMLLFIRFNRIGHFGYIRFDALLSRFFQVVCLPAVSTYWRYVDSLEINQGQSVLRGRLGSHLHMSGYCNSSIISSTSRLRSLFSLNCFSVRSIVLVTGV